LELFQKHSSLNKEYHSSLSRAARSVWLCCFCFLSVFTIGQSLTVIDGETGTPLSEAVLIWDLGGVIDANSSGIITVARTKDQNAFRIMCPGYWAYYGEANFLSGAEIISLQPTHEELQPVNITAYGSQTSALRSPIPLALIDGKELNSGFVASMADVLNLQPGIKMDERGYGGSRRINIRGSSLRSPFAVRNIKMYWNGIPVTSPDGSSPLEMFDNGDIGQIEVIKGPAGSHYGSGTGGVVLLQPVNHTEAVPFESNNKLFARVSYAHQSTDGYREQEANEKNNISLNLDFHTSEKIEHHLSAIYYSGMWELPGAIKWTEVQETPTMAQPFSIDGNAHVERNRLWVGLRQDWQMNDRLSNTTSIYGTQTDKINPYGTSPFFNGYKDEDAIGIGGRTEFQLIPAIRGWHRISLGGEWQTEDHHIDEWTNDLGNPGELKYSNGTQSTAGLLFLSTSYSPWPAGTLDAGVSLSQTMFDNEGVSQVGDENLSLNTELDLGLEILPRVSFSQRIHANGYAFVSYSVGNSTPSLFEMIDVSTGFLNTELRPEKGTSVEIGYKAVYKDRIIFNVNAYQMDLTNAILPQLQGDEQVIFRNAGEISQNGIESTVMFSILEDGDGDNISARIGGSLNLSDFEFADYTSGDININGNKLTGVPLAQASLIASVNYKGVLLNMRHFWYDKAPLDDANSQWSQAYNVVNVTAGYGLSFGHFDIELTAGVNNAFDAVYSSFYQLNGVFGKFHNPSPERNYFGGIKVAFRPYKVLNIDLRP
jgi:iron complex outermembrane receptor protein